MKRAIFTMLAVSGLALSATTASAYTLDLASGTGFVGKGEVQTVLGLNNNQVQSTPVEFTLNSVTAQETTWTCINERNEHVQERTRTTTTETTGLVSSVARMRNQITGYNLTGFSGATTTTSSTEGPPLESCPNVNSSFVLGSTVVGDVETRSGGLYVNGVLLP